MCMVLESSEPHNTPHLPGTMPRERLPLQALSVWMDLNNAVFSRVEVQPIQHKGHGLVAVAQAQADLDDGHLNDDNDTGRSQPPLITVPHDLVLNAEAVEQYAKEDRNFRALLDACGHKVIPSFSSPLSLACRTDNRYRARATIFSCFYWSSWSYVPIRLTMLHSQTRGRNMSSYLMTPTCQRCGPRTSGCCSTEPHSRWVNELNLFHGF